MYNLKRVAVAATLTAMVFVATGRAQEPPAPPTEASTPPAANPAAKQGGVRYSHANDFLIHGTVFNDKAISFPNVELRIRRAGEKKYRWQSHTNSRGEFAMRVPTGAQYEMVVNTKGFKEQVKAIDAKNGMNDESVVFRMEPVTGEKK
jgi:hypothetical protein